MFTSITWELFFAAILLSGTGYYTVTVLLLYHSEIIQWVRSRSQQSVGPNPEPHIEPRPNRNIMGEINQVYSAPVKTSVPTEELAIADSDDEPETIQTSVPSEKADLLIGNIADLLQEIKTLVRHVSENKSDKAESQSLFQALLIHHQQLRNTTYQDAISLYICNEAKDQFSFDLSVNEVNTWWSEEPIINK